MHNTPTILIRSLIIYAICVPLALFLGYLIANPVDVATLVIACLIAALICFPLLLRWHYQLMLLSWSCTAVMFFLPGSPDLRLLMIVLSLGFSILQHILDRSHHFIYVPSVTWPLVFMAAVVLFTAKLNGGMGFRSLGGNVYGGKHYVLLLLGMLAYFALSAQRIPRDRARLYVGFFLIGGITSVISDLYSFAPSSFRYLFLIFPPSLTSLLGNVEVGTTRMSSAGATGIALTLFMVSRYGLAGIFSGKLWRLPVFFFSACLGLLGGHRGYVLTLGLILIFQFFLERLHRTRLMGRFLVLGVVAGAMMVAFSNKLPFTLQRSLSFLPLEFDREALDSGEATMEWRIQMWTGLLPQIPKHLLLGKGYTLTAEDFDMTAGFTAFNAREFDASEGGMALAGDYHNGWLSVILPFGIWGVLGVCWFLYAAGRVMYRNYQYGDPELRIINTLLFAMFLEATLIFTFGHLHTDILNFTGVLGLSVALNGGVARRVAVPQPGTVATRFPAMPLHPRPTAGRIS
jgi:hypothetical protein